MPFEFELDGVMRVVRSRGFGVFTDDDLFNHLKIMRELFADGTLDATWAQVADFSAVESFHDVSTEGIWRQARLNPWPKVSFRAVIAPMDVAFGLARMYQSLCEEKGENVCIVRSEAEALAWITQEKVRAGQATK